MSSEGSMRPPQWAKPAPLGYAQAADAAHFVAAPLLAAAVAAMIGVVVADADKFRWPSVALLLLAGAGIALVASVQYGFHARALLYSPAELEEWWGRADFEKRKSWLRSRQKAHYGAWKTKIGRAVTAYNIGATLLGSAVAVCLAPAAAVQSGGAVVRWVAAGLVAVAAAGELAWTVLTMRKGET